jgi:hypothetical protein
MSEDRDFFAAINSLQGTNRILWDAQAYFTYKAKPPDQGDRDALRILEACRVLVALTECRKP